MLSLARSLGEFGAVKIVSGNIAGQSQTATLSVEETYQNFQQGTAYALAALLAFIAMACLVIVALLRPKEDVMRFTPGKRALTRHQNRTMSLSARFPGGPE